jgi:hypothetical protein
MRVIVTCYHAARHRDGAVKIIAHDKESGERYDLPHVVKHSPTGMEWGYAGSGPADLARSILIDAIGPAAAACPLCNGSRRIVWASAGAVDEFAAYDPDVHGDADPETITECMCDGGYRQLPYQQFKFHYVARWPADHWSITRADVLRWLVREHGEEIPAWLIKVIGVDTVELPEVPS